MPIRQCLHQNVIETVRTIYYFKKGWEEEIENPGDPIDIKDSEVETESSIFRCQDCKKLLQTSTT